MKALKEQRVLAWEKDRAKAIKNEKKITKVEPKEEPGDEKISKKMETLAIVGINYDHPSSGNPAPTTQNKGASKGKNATGSSSSSSKGKNTKEASSKAEERPKKAMKVEHDHHQEPLKSMIAGPPIKCSLQQLEAASSNEEDDI